MPLVDRKCSLCGHREEDLLERPTILAGADLCPQCGEPTFEALKAAPNFTINGNTLKAMDFWDRENSNCTGSYGNSYTKLDLRDKKMAAKPVYSK